MKTELFDYNLPTESIAQFPPEKRGTTRLLVLNKQTGAIEHKRYFNLPSFIQEGDVVVLNKTKVLKARIFPKVKRTGKQVECLFLSKLEEKDEFEYWEALIGRAKDVKFGDILELDGFEIEVYSRESGAPGFVVRTKNAFEIMKKFGHVPLPPYIKRSDTTSDRIRYNTVFGQNENSVAAPTASLNLTPEILTEIEKRGAKICYVTLNVSWGTFAPVNTEQIEDFKIHSEIIEVPEETAKIVNSAKNRVWAFGTTVVRTLESVASDHEIKPFAGPTSLFIYPGYKFKVVDVLVTNFHAPKSSLVMLVSAFAGTENIKNAYDTAINEGYKFLSYGDSMLIL